MAWMREDGGLQGQTFGLLNLFPVAQQYKDFGGEDGGDRPISGVP